MKEECRSVHLTAVFVCHCLTLKIAQKSHFRPRFYAAIFSPRYFKPKIYSLEIQIHTYIAHNINMNSI